MSKIDLSQYFSSHVLKILAETNLRQCEFKFKRVFKNNVININTEATSLVWIMVLHSWCVQMYWLNWPVHLDLSKRQFDFNKQIGFTLKLHGFTWYHSYNAQSCCIVKKKIIYQLIISFWVTLGRLLLSWHINFPWEFILTNVALVFMLAIISKMAYF